MILKSLDMLIARIKFYLNAPYSTVEYQHSLAETELLKLKPRFFYLAENCPLHKLCSSLALGEMCFCMLHLQILFILCALG